MSVCEDPHIIYTFFSHFISKIFKVKIKDLFSFLHNIDSSKRTIPIKIIYRIQNIFLSVHNIYSTILYNKFLLSLFVYVWENL